MNMYVNIISNNHFHMMNKWKKIKIIKMTKYKNRLKNNNMLLKKTIKSIRNKIKKIMNKIKWMKKNY